MRAIETAGSGRFTWSAWVAVAACSDSGSSGDGGSDSAGDRSSVGDSGSDGSSSDSTAVDSSATDTATTDAGGTPTWGPYTPLGCKKFVNTNTDGTLNPYISPARDGQFYVSWVQKSGDLMLTWESPTSCKSTVGPLQVNKTAGTVYDWGGIAVVSDKAGNFYAVWESKASGAEISLAWSTTGKDFSLPLEVVSTSTNGQNQALWVSEPGKVHAGVPLADTDGQDDQVAIGEVLVVTPDDRVVVIWGDERKKKSGNENDVFADSSADGLTWGADVQVNDNDARYQQGPSMAVGFGAGCKGAVYAVWQDFRSKKSYDVYIARSTDGGLTWSKNEAVASDLAEDEMNPAIAVDKGCVIGVAWRDSTKNSNFDIGTAYLKW